MERDVELPPDTTDAALGWTVWIRVSGRWRHLPKKWWDDLEGPKPYSGFENDGCSFVRDDIWRYGVWPACVIHDWHFSQEILEHEKDPPTFGRANRIFGRNTYRILRVQGMGRWRAGFYAIKRYVAVQKLGRRFFRRR